MVFCDPRVRVSDPGCGMTISDQPAIVGNIEYRTWDCRDDTRAGVSVAPKEFGLEQNYPNPFQPSSTISFAVPKQTQVRLQNFQCAWPTRRDAGKRRESRRHIQCDLDAGISRAGFISAECSQEIISSRGR